MHRICEEFDIGIQKARLAATMSCHRANSESGLFFIIYNLQHLHFAIFLNLHLSFVVVWCIDERPHVLSTIGKLIEKPRNMKPSGEICPPTTLYYKDAFPENLLWDFPRILQCPEFRKVCLQCVKWVYVSVHCGLSHIPLKGHVLGENAISTPNPHLLDTSSHW